MEYMTLCQALCLLSQVLCVSFIATNNRKRSSKLQSAAFQKISAEQECNARKACDDQRFWLSGKKKDESFVFDNGSEA
jgi:hypothetical protein